MNTPQALFINDAIPLDSELQRLEVALGKELVTLEENFDLKWRETNLLTEPIDAIVSDIMSSHPLPSLLLVDANMPNYRDGIRLINSLRRAGYAGFTYLWSAADLSDELDAFPAMLKQVGSGGFMSGQEAQLARKVRSDWDSCGRSFQVNDPTKMSLIDPEDAALQILNEFLPGCLLSESNSNDLKNWEDACDRASLLFSGAPGSFESVVSSFPKYDSSRFDDAADLVKLLRNTEANNHVAIFKALTNLRDSLLDVANSCEEALGFRV